MDDETDIGVIDAHTKGIGGDEEAAGAAGIVVLDADSFFAGHTGVIGGGVLTGWG